MDELLDFASLENLERLTRPRQAQQYSTPPSGPQGLPGIASPMPAPTPPSYEQIASNQPVQPPAAPLPRKPTKHIELLRDAIRRTESSGNYQAKNPHTSASGAYQYINSTWNNYGGYPEARLAPKQVQDRRITEDLVRRLEKYKGDPFRVIASHYLPARANSPELWTQPMRLQNRGKVITVAPVAEYVAKVVKGTPYESAFEQYLKAHSGAE